MSLKRVVLWLVAAGCVLPAAAAQRFKLAQVLVGAGPTRILPAPEIGYVFVSVADDRKVAAIRIADDTLAASIDVGMRPNSLAFDSNRRRLLVAGPGRIEAYAIDGVGFSLAGATDVEEIQWPLALEFDAAHDHFLLTDYYFDYLAAIDAGSLGFDARNTARTYQAFQVLIGPRLVLPNGWLQPQDETATAAVVTEIDPQDLTEKRVAFRGVGRSISAVYSARHDRLYSVADRISWLSVGDFADDKETYLPIGRNPWSLVLDDDADQLYVGHWQGAVITRLDGTSLVSSSIALPGPGRTLAIDPPQHLLYAADLDNSQVSVIDTRSDKVLGTYPTGKTPHITSLEPGSHKLYLANFDDGSVSIMSPVASSAPGGSDVTADPEVIDADGASRSLITVTPRDGDGQPLGPGHLVTISSTAGSLVPPVLDLKNGRYTQELASTTTVETAIVSAKVDGQPLSTQPRVSFHTEGWADLRLSEPEWGLTSGGTVVTLKGSGFLTGLAPGKANADGNLFVYFGDAASADILSATDTEIVCITPAHAEGVVDVAVEKLVGGEQRKSWLRGGFTYVGSEELSLKLVKGSTPGEVHLNWSDGPSGPVKLYTSPSKDFAGDVTEIAGLRGPATSDFPGQAVTYYHIER